MRNIVLLLTLCLVSLTANAANIGLMPLGARTVENDANQVLTLTNREAEPVKMQVRVFTWSQVDGHDVLVQTTALIATPGIVELPAGGKAKIRLRKLGHGNAFRVLVSELPKPISEQATQVGFRLEYSLPFLFEPAGAPQAVLVASRASGRVVLTNKGGHAAKITAVGPTAATPWPITLPNAGWILPGSTMSISVPATTERIELVVDSKPLSLTVQ